MAKLGRLNLLWFPFLLVLGNSVVKTTCSLGAGNYSGCHEGERQALIEFKRGIIEDPYGILARSWNGTECCRWHGVGCDGVTGHVIKLNLWSDIFPTFREMSNSLLELKHLSYLDLSGSNFWGMKIPEFIGSMTQLTYLNLSNSRFHGPVPHSLGNLTYLQALDLSSTDYSYDDNHLEADDLEWVSRLSSLERLDMSGVNLSRARNVDKVLSRIPSFISLTLSNCGLDNTHLPLAHNLINSTSTSTEIVKIQHLDLSRNLFEGEFPPPILRNITVSLLVLDLSYNNFQGEMFELSHTNVDIYENLEMLVLSDNQFNGSIPEVLCKMKALVHLDLSRNKLSGNLPLCLQDLQQLRVLRLGSNMLSGDLIIPSSLGTNLSCSLQILQLSNNSFEGELPSGLSACTNLTFLGLGSNRLSGCIPEWLGEKFTSLITLRLDTNNFSGSIPEGLCQIPWLKYLIISSNNLTGHIPGCFGYRSGQAADDHRSFVNKGVNFPLASSWGLRAIDFSQNNLGGVIPEELTGFSGLYFLNLSHNHLSGRIPDKIGDLENLEALDLSHNLLSGTIPASMSNITYLSVLNLSYNKLRGRIPSEDQLLTFDSSSYYGNPELCGLPLPLKCQSDNSSQFPQTDCGEGENETNNLCFYWGILCGFAMGFCVVIEFLVLNMRWRQALFRYVEVALDRFLLNDKSN